MDIYLISENTIKSETVINDNVDTMYILPAIYTAQNMGLRELTGSDFLDKLCDMVATGQIETEPEYKKFLDTYIRPYLKFKVCSELTIPLAYKYRNSGVIQTNNDHEVNTVMKDAQTMKQYYDDRANYFGEQIKKYMHKKGWCRKEYCDKYSDSLGYAINIVL